MAAAWYTTGGLDFGGQGDFSTTPPLDCNLRLNDDGLITQLDLMSGQWEGHYQAGLFQNDYHPRFDTLLSDLQIADFGGYAGLKPTFHWTAGVIEGVRAVTTAQVISWVGDGTGNQNWIYGYYVVNALGQLQWAERLCSNPIRVRAPGDTVRVTPRFTLRNEFADS